MIMVFDKRYFGNACLVFVLVVSTCFSSLAKSIEEVKKYYQLINDGEIYICSGKLNKAYDCYNKAYTIFDTKMPSRHLYNYFVLSADLKHWGKCKLILTELRKREWKKDEYQKLVSLFDSESAIKLTELYKETSNFKPVLDGDYTRAIDSVVLIDQKTNKYLRSLNSGLLIGEGLDSMNRLTDNNINYLKLLFVNKKPTDNVIGRYSVPWSKPRYFIVLHHNAQGYNNRVLDDIFYEGLQEGWFPPEDFEMWTSLYSLLKAEDTILNCKGLSFTVPLFAYTLIDYRDSLFQLKKDDTAKIARYNLERKKIPGLCTNEEQKKKIIYQYYNKKYFFVYTEYIDKFGEDLPPKFRKHLIYLNPKQ
ncbi:MAG: hypothetical protein ACK4EY_01190 [Flavipsychrobacter sp.]